MNQPTVRLSKGGPEAMPEGEADRMTIIAGLIEEHLQPHVKRIDTDAYYPVDYMTALGRSGLLQSAGIPDETLYTRGIQLVEQTAKVCMTTGFNLWCHLAALTYVRKSRNVYMKESILPLLENGGLLGGTGLSNPMKFYAGIDKLHLQAEPVEGGYVFRGTLPMVSNLGDDHWFGVVASTMEGRRLMAFIPCSAARLKRTERVGYLGLNGSATYTCEFDGVFVPRQWMLSEDADALVKEIRPVFVLYQIPLGLGVIEGSIRSMRQVQDRQGGCNRFLKEQPEDLEAGWSRLRSSTYELAGTASLPQQWENMLQLRLETAYWTLQTVQASMLHHGGAGYLQASAASRRLREAYFFANLTPTVKHLEKLTQGLRSSE